MADICVEDQSIPSSPGSEWNILGSAIVGKKSGDEAGYSVSLNSDGTIVAVGAPNTDVNGSENGVVRVYQYKDESGTWLQLGDDIDGEAVGDNTGWSVSLSSNGKIVAIGSPFNNLNNFNHNRGLVRVYQYKESLGTGSWIQLGNDIHGKFNNGLSGFSVSLSSNGNVVAIGEPYSGLVIVYQYKESLGTGSWIQLGDNIYGKSVGDLSGFSVSLSSNGNVVAIGPYFNRDDSVRVYEYEELSTTWKKLGGDLSGFSVSLNSDGNIVAIGSPFDDDDDRGYIKVYKYEESLGIGSWIQLGDDIYGEANGDFSGISVSLSSDGTTVAIGALYVNLFFGFNDNKRSVRVYQYKESSGSGSWTKLGNYIDGQAEYEEFGRSLSLSSDGKHLAIGIPRNDGGYVIVYKLTLPEIEIELLEDKIPKCIIPNDHISRRVRGCGERVFGIPKQEKRSVKNAIRIRVYSRYRRI